MTMTRPPSTAPAGPPRTPGDPGPAGYSPDPGHRGGFRAAGIPVTLTPGAYLLGVLAAGFSAIALPALDPGQSLAGYLAAAAGVVIVLLASMAGHELAHSIAARRLPSASSAGCGTARPSGPDRPRSRNCPAPPPSGGWPRRGH